MSEHISPEEKLLRLIRGAKPLAGAARAAGGVRLIAGARAAAAWAVRCFSGRKAYAAAISASALVVLATFVSPFFFEQRIRALKGSADVQLIEPAPDSASAQARPLEYYTQPLEGREVFGRIAAPETEAPSIAKIKASDQVASFTLIGVVSSEPPQAILEDKQTQKTYYVSRGQSIGDVRIEEIKEGRIIVTCNGERFELYM